jgi:putative transposase
MSVSEPSDMEARWEVPARLRLELLALLSADPTKPATMTYDEFLAWADEDALAESVDGKGDWLWQQPLPSPTRALLGLKDAVVPSDGPRQPAPRFYRRGERKLRRAQRTFSRRQKGSRNKARARAKVARVHRHVANQRTDFTHKLSTILIKNHQAVCIEDLNVRGLARTKQAKSVHDASMGMVRRQLQYKGQWYGVHVIVVDRFYPSTQLCRVCGFKNEALTLADRTGQCPICGTVHDRDLNAALNIRDEGLRLLAVGHTESRSACGEAVRPPTVARPDEARIPRL